MSEDTATNRIVAEIESLASLPTGYRDETGPCGYDPDPITAAIIAAESLEGWTPDDETGSVDETGHMREYRFASGRVWIFTGSAGFQTANIPGPDDALEDLV